MKQIAIEPITLMSSLALLMLLSLTPAHAAYQPLTVIDDVNSNTYTHVRQLIIHGGVITNGSTGDITFTTNGDVSAASDFTDHAIIRGDGGAKGIQTSAIIIDDSDNLTGVTSLTIDGATGDTVTVDTDGLVYNATNGTFGIGFATPAATLDVNGSIALEGTTCLDVSSDQIYHDTDCDGTKDAGEEFIDLTGADISSGTAGAVQFSNGSGLASDASNFYWDSSNGRLAVGGNTPTEALEVTGDAIVSTDIHIGANLVHDGDTDTSINFTDDDIDIIVGNETMINFTEDGTQDIIELGDDGDIDIKLSAGADSALFVEGSTANVGIGDTAPGAKLEVNGTLAITPSASTAIVAGTGITATRALMRITGSGGAVDISADPQIADGTDGQIVVLKGMSNTNTVLIENGTGLKLQSAASYTMGNYDTITLIYDALDDLWIEISRSNK